MQMIIEIDGRFINLSHVREVSFDGEATTFHYAGPERVFDTDTFQGDYRSALVKATGGSKLTTNDLQTTTRN